MELIRGFRLRPIRSKEDYETALSVIEPLMMRDDLAEDEEEYADVLSALIEDYEDEHFPTRDVSGVEVLLMLIESSGRTQAQIAKEAGLSESTVSEILKGKRGIGRKHMEAFGRVFKIDPGVFMTAGAHA